MTKIVFPKEPVKVVRIPKAGYNSLSVLKETEKDFEVQLYNPNVMPLPPVKKVSNVTIEGGVKA